MRTMLGMFASAILWLTASASVPAATSADNGNGRRLITARMMHATLQDAGNDHVSPPVYRAKLADVKVIQGNPDFPTAVDVELKARHIEVATRHERIYAVVDLQDGVLRLRYWGPVIPIACIPEDLITADYESRYFDEEWNSPKQKCTFVDEYQAVD